MDKNLRRKLARPPTTPTVKSDPWKKGRYLRSNPRLWPETFWKTILHFAQDGGKKRPLSGKCLELVCEINLKLYGKR